ncbi:hypothetical protein ACRB68_53620 [Actinomadura sp. RB68]|uniref:Replication-relaxation n=1 Tax=Actinomadura macrotermitis TaxID=2585200 RepID=A0A7K0C2B1_9ACTN|nr:hypothetical protein [Actinomadura macrotermitis]
MVRPGKVGTRVGNLAHPGDLLISLAAAQALTVLYRCRLATADHLQALITPHAASSRYIRAELGKLERAGLVGAVRRRGAHRQRVWFLTRSGATAAEASPDIQPRPYRMTAPLAAGPLQAHALAVTDLLTALHVGGWAALEDCAVEVAHGPAGSPGTATGSARAMVITDAVIRLQPDAVAAGLPPVLFVELDRGTTSVHTLATKLAAYDAYRQHRPATRAAAGAPPSWRTRYSPGDRRTPFPLVLVVIDTPGPVALRRVEAVRRVLATQRPVEGLDEGELAVAVTTLGLLQRDGLAVQQMLPLNPHAPVRKVALTQLYAAVRPARYRY